MTDQEAIEAMCQVGIVVEILRESDRTYGPRTVLIVQGQCVDEGTDVNGIDHVAVEI